MNQRYTKLHGLYLARMETRLPGTWRVDGITNIRENCRHADVRLSPINEGYSKKPYITKALPAKAGEPFKVHISMISHFITGSIWENGRRVFIPELDKEKIGITPEKALYTSLVPDCHLPSNWPGELLPQSYFPLALESREALRNARYAVVPIENSTTLQFLIVPCIELARFYFGVSSRMMTDLIRGRIKERYANFDSKNSTEDGIVQINRKILLSRPETLVIAQALISRRARSAMFGAHNALITQKLNNIPLEIDCKFPCHGLIHLAVGGKRIKVPTVDGKGSVWALFAMHLESSDHRLNAYRIDLIDELLSASSTGQDSATYVPQDQPHLDEEKPPPLNDLAKANQQLKREIELSYSERFPALREIRISHPKKNSRDGEKRYVPTKGAEIEVDTLTTAEGDYKNGNLTHQGISQFTTEIDKASYIARDLDLFLDTCSILGTALRDSGWRCSIQEINRNPIIDKQSYSRFEKTTTLPWTYVRGHARHLVLYKMIDANNQYYYLLEMELKDSEIQNGQSIDVP